MAMLPASAESLETRTLFASAVLTSAFTVVGEAKSNFGGGQVVQLVRVNPTDGTRSIIAKLETPGGLAGSIPLLTGVKAVALGPGGSLVVVGSKPPFLNPGGGDVTRVVRVNPASGVATVVKDFPPLGLNAPAIISKASEVAVNAAGDIFLAGTGPRLGTFTPVPEVVRISAATGVASIVSQFASQGLNAPPALNSIGGLAIDPAGNVLVAGEGSTFSSAGVGVRVIRVNPSSGVQSVAADFTQLSGGLGFQVLMKNAVGVAAAPDGTIYIAGQTLSGTTPVVGRVSASTGAKSFLTQFTFAGGNNPAGLAKLTDIAFAPAQNRVVVVGTRPTPGVPSSAGLVNSFVVRLDRNTGAQSVVSQVAGLPPGAGFLTKPLGITAGLTGVSALPKPVVKGPVATVAGRSTAFTINTGATTSADRAKIRRILIDWNGDGGVDQITDGTSNITDGTSNTIVSHAFTRFGTYNVLVSVVRIDGSVSPFGSSKIRVDLPA